MKIIVYRAKVYYMIDTMVKVCGSRGWVGGVWVVLLNLKALTKEKTIKE